MNIIKIEKPWGYEKILESNDKYTLKKLFMKSGHSCSLQLHNIKHETFYVINGKMLFEYGYDKDTLNKLELLKGEYFTVPPKMIHRMTSLDDCTYLESSTSELDDVIRFEDKYGRAGNNTEEAVTIKYKYKTAIEQAIEYINPRYRHILEFGVFSGKSIRAIQSICKKNRLAFDFYGFDSFKGLPEDWYTPNGDIVCKKERFDRKGVAPNVRNAKLFIGWFKDTIPKYMELAEPISLLHIDCDLYSSTIEVLNGLNEFIVAGTVIVMDEWCARDKSKRVFKNGEQIAFWEWVQKYDRRVDIIDSKFKSKNIERKIIIVTK
jgi:mannose-6-phosphate isomerase